MLVLLGHLLASYGLLAIFLVMLIKEAGVPLPVPSDLIMVTAGVQVATGAYSLLLLLLALELALLVGASIQFLLARRVGRSVINRVGRWIGLNQEQLARAEARLQRRGSLAIIVGLNLPGARAAVIPSAGLAGLSYRAFLPAMLLGSSLFYGWHLALGYFLGPSAVTLLAQVHLPVVPVILGLAVIGLLVWLVLRRRRKAKAGTLPEAGRLDGLRAWSEAACPACLAAALLQRESL